MNDDQLLEALGELAREQDAGLDPRQKELTFGALSDDEVAALAAEDPDAFAAFEPIDAAREDAIAAAIQQQVAPNVVSLDAARTRRRGPMMAAVATVVAIAAAAVLFLMPGGEPPLPGYDLSLTGGQQLHRGPDGAEAEVAQLHPTGTIDLQLRPEQRLEGVEVTLRAWLVTAGGEARPWAPPVDAAPGGAFRIRGKVGALFDGVPAGRYDLVLAVGNARAVGPLTAPPEGSDGLVVTRTAVEVLPR